ncbi:hypothetical protein D3C72_838720 [compost metagenome]
MTAFSKLFVGTVIFTLGALSISGYAAKKAYEADPDILHKIGSQAEKRGFQVHFGSFDSRPHEAYERTEGTWNFKSPSELSVTTVSGDVTIEGISGDEVLVTASGELDRSQADQLVTAVFEGKGLSLREPDNNAVKDLKLKIQVPSTFKGPLKITTVSGNLIVERVESSKLTIVSVSGDVLAKDVSIPEISVGSVNGEVRVENLIGGNIHVTSVSGDVLLRIVDGDKSNINPSTISGDVQSRYAMGQHGKYLIEVNTTSGDIVIE